VNVEVTFLRDRNSPSQAAGSVLLAVLMIAALLAAAVGTYLSLTLQANTGVKRSAGWNGALPLAEAGIEEALSHVNRNINGYAVDGWAFTNGVFVKQKSMGNSYYTVNLSGTPGGVVRITSTGYGCWKPANYIARTVEVTAQTPTPFIPMGIEATNITFGGHFGADSYDSSNSLYSTGGNYDPAKATALVTIATPGLGFSMAGSAHIRGYVATGPGGMVTIGGSAFVGDVTYSGAGIQPGHETNNFMQAFSPVSAPFTDPSQARAPTNGTIAGTNYDYVLTGGKYFTTNLAAATYGQTLYVASNSTLFVTGPVKLSKVVFAAGTMPRLNLYVSAPSLDFTPTILGGTPPQFWIYGLPSCTSLNLGAHTQFQGVIYAPQVNLQGHGNSSFCGAIVAASFSCFGTFDFHYDSSTRAVQAQAFRILSWAEL
jgi:hypothetical protein